MSESAPPVQSPRAIVMQMLQGAWVCQAISSVTRLGVPDLLQEHGPLSASHLVEKGVGARPELLQRVLRVCASLGVFSEDADGRFGPTPLSEVLTLGSPMSVKRFAELYGGRRWWQLWGGLTEAVRSGQPRGETFFAAWEPKDVEAFGEAMKSRMATLVPVLERLDLSTARTLVDVGGGFGHVAIWLLGRHPELRATVLDLPEVSSIAERRAQSEDPEIRARLSFAAGDMFADVPAGDTYLLSGILHDWDDASCLRVLRNCRDRMQEKGSVICLDAVLPPFGDTSGTPAKLLDLLMLVSLPGKERSEAEWRSLLDGAGLVVASITTLDPGSRASIVVGTRREG